MSLFITYVSSTCFEPHRSIFRSGLYKLYSQIWLCGNTRTTRHVQPLLCNGWTCRVVLTVVPHIKSANTACKTLLMMDRWGSKHVELNKTHSLKHFVYVVGLHIYCKMIHGPYNVKFWGMFYIMVLIRGRAIYILTRNENWNSKWRSAPIQKDLFRSQ